jgi:CheY-like chemotaxis protein
MIRDAPRVLVVDDDLPICELLELAFADKGWDVRVRTRGEDALDLLRRWTGDVILLDLHMPEMDAEAFLSGYRGQKPAEWEIPVLLLSASSNLDDHATRLGVSAVVAKPFDVDTRYSTERQVVAEGRTN